MTEQELIQEAENIRDEYRKKHNTAYRIGSFFLNLISFFRGENYVSEAPADGKIYGRKNSQWVECDSDDVPTQPKYPLSYDRNGGTMTNYNGGTPSGDYEEGDLIGLPTTVPSRDGYIFAGWSDSVNGQLWQPGDQYTPGMTSPGLQFTAIWEAVYPLTYDLSGGEITDYDGGTPPGNYPVGTVLFMPLTVPARQGYAFGGWKSNVTGEVIPVGEPAPFVMLPGFVVFTAVWNNLIPVIKNVQVTGYEGKFAGDDAQLYIVWEVENPERVLPVAGYKYTVVIQIQDLITQHPKEILLPTNNSVYFFTGLPTLDAVHYTVRIRTGNPQMEKEIGFNIIHGSKYPLTYALDGGSIANYNGGTRPGYCEKGDLIALPSTVPVREGFIFLGWRDSIGNVIWKAGDEFLGGMPENPLTFTALWRDEPTPEPTEEPEGPTEEPTQKPTEEPERPNPTDVPTEEPEEVPTEGPTEEPAEEATTAGPDE